MHILIIPSEHLVTEKFPLAGIFQYEQAKALANAGFQVGVISVGFTGAKQTFSKYTFIKHEAHENLNIYRHYNRSFLPQRFLPFRLVSSRWLNVFKKMFSDYVEKHGKPDVVHAHNFLYAGVLAKYTAEEYGIPFVLTEHSTSFARELVPKYLDKSILAICSASGALSCVSLPFKKLLQHRFEYDFSVLHNIVDSVFFEDELRPQHNDSFTILNVASLDSKKNHALALRAFADSLKYKNAVFRIAGEGPLKDSLERLAYQLGIVDKVVFLGLLSREEVRDEMLQSDCFLLSSDYETFGVVLIEALACGIPLISTKSGGPEDIVTDCNGLLVDVGSQEQLSLALLKMHSEHSGYSREILRTEAHNRFGEKSFVRHAHALYRKAIQVDDPS